MAPRLPLSTNHLGARGVRKACQLFEALACRPSILGATLDGDKKGALDRWRDLNSCAASARCVLPHYDPPLGCAVMSRWAMTWSAAAISTVERSAPPTIRSSIGSARNHVRCLRA